MKKFRVSAVGREFLGGVEIEATTADEAEAMYRDMWEDGQIEACDYEMEYTTTEINGEEV